ncbi:MAG: hypothetical protein GY929_07560 [Actinomycetia bacterium]|nr:hypothetical protein [Actinomycetes bacterium]
MSSTTESIIGRANRDGAALFRSWFDAMTSAPERGEQTAYVFVMGSFAELLSTFGLHTSFPEINSLQVAIRGEAAGYLEEAEDYGYSPDICGYVKADVAMQLRGGSHPMGTIPPPSIAVFTNACATYVKWAEIWERLYGIPCVTIDLPGPRTESYTGTGISSEDRENELRYVVGQIHELIRTLEEVTGNPFDIDRLRQALGHANAQAEAWRRVHEINQNVPAVYNAVTDGTVYLGVANAFRGTPEGARYFADLVEELDYCVQHGRAALDDERYRLAFVGVPCYPLFRGFNEMFTSHGGIFVTSSYTSFASGGADVGFTYDLDHPVESLAEGMLVTTQAGMHRMFHVDRWLADRASDFSLDGIIYHPIKSCRTVSTGLADARRSAGELTGVPSLFLESDMMDDRVVSEAQMRNRVEAFFEGLSSRGAVSINTGGRS